MTIDAQRVILWVIPAAWLSGHIQYALVAAGHVEREYRSRLIGAGSTIVLTLVLAPTLGSAGTALALLAGNVAVATAAWVLTRGVLPDCEYAKSLGTSSPCCLGCLALGPVATPTVGDLPATVIAGGHMMSTAVVAGRSDLRHLVHMVFDRSAQRPEGTITPQAL